MLIPFGFSGQIPFLSLGSDVGKRTPIHSGSSKVSGDFVVEDVEVDGEVFRRLVFLDNQFLVQSEAKVRTVKRKNKERQVIDFGHISQYHAFMCVSIHLLPTPAHAHVAILGLGGGGLAMFLKKSLPNASLVAVDLDQAMVEVAKDHFELEIDDKLQVVVKDGLDFLKDGAENGTQLDCIMFDVDSKDRTLGLSCPPPQFLTNETLDHVDRMLKEDGHFILNLVCRDKALQETIMESLKRHFKHIVSIKLYEEVNEVIFATNSNASYNVEDLENAAKNLNANAREKKLVKVKCVDLKDLLQSVNIIV